MNYLWQHKNWPNFTYDEKRVSASLLYRYAQATNQLTQNLANISEPLKIDAMIDLMVKEAINSSAIEGENLNPNDVRSSLKNHLGLSHPPTHIRDPRAKGITALMINNFQQQDTNLSADALFRWHRMLLPNDYDTWGRSILICQWRTEGIEVVSGRPNKQKIHFEGPPAKQVAEEMKLFFSWYNDTVPTKLAQNRNLIPGPIRAAIVHLWFVTIHPFDDGNGRIARALSDHALSQDTQSPWLHSLSTAIEKNRNDYYNKLEKAQSGSMNITNWILWFLDITCESIDITEKITAFTIEKSNYLKRYQKSINERQSTILLYLFANGAEGDSRSINRNKYVSLTQCSPRTALRDLKDLMAKEALKQLPGLGRNTRYGLNMKLDK